MVRAITATKVYKCGLTKIAWKIAPQSIQDVNFFVDKYLVLTPTGKFCGDVWGKSPMRVFREKIFLATNMLQTSKLMFNQVPEQWQLNLFQTYNYKLW